MPQQVAMCAGANAGHTDTACQLMSWEDEALDEARGIGRAIAAAAAAAVYGHAALAVWLWQHVDNAHRAQSEASAPPIK
eukprot:CAMPEP_0202887074 /NCGR_PEP_ID=MMETSP1391-20130828/42495_1 /ASSEMBLY_ACC=CAM_ASM_000867 /TAXON_ID=1034604 /ORGANISM="Chlamydomonas leiostraca, Strain SAG 11-49" /LENGTH=78 /DNA_ID=CAMNT_0049570349 /DNA_START=550 /DNA_END=787 /DNA_ORIENTATION=+